MKLDEYLLEVKYKCLHCDELHEFDEKQKEHIRKSFRAAVMQTNGHGHDTLTEEQFVDVLKQHYAMMAVLPTETAKS